MPSDSSKSIQNSSSNSLEHYKFLYNNHHLNVAYVFAQRIIEKTPKVSSRFDLKIWCRYQVKWDPAYATQANSQPLISEIPRHAVSIPLFPRHTETKGTEIVWRVVPAKPTVQLLFSGGIQPVENCCQPCRREHSQQFTVEADHQKTVIKGLLASFYFWSSAMLSIPALQR